MPEPGCAHEAVRRCRSFTGFRLRTQALFPSDLQMREAELRVSLGFRPDMSRYWPTCPALLGGREMRQYQPPIIRPGMLLWWWENEDRRDRFKDDSPEIGC